MKKPIEQTLFEAASDLLDCQDSVSFSKFSLHFREFRENDNKVMLSIRLDNKNGYMCHFIKVITESGSIYSTSGFDEKKANKIYKKLKAEIF